MLSEDSVETRNHDADMNTLVSVWDCLLPHYDNDLDHDDVSRCLLAGDQCHDDPRGADPSVSPGTMLQCPPPLKCCVPGSYSDTVTSSSQLPIRPRGVKTCQSWAPLRYKSCTKQSSPQSQLTLCQPWSASLNNLEMWTTSSDSSPPWM